MVMSTALGGIGAEERSVVKSEPNSDPQKRVPGGAS